jgi:hypothetical protein
MAEGGPSRRGWRSRRLARGEPSAEDRGATPVIPSSSSSSSTSSLASSSSPSSTTAAASSSSAAALSSPSLSSSSSANAAAASSLSSSSPSPSLSPSSSHYAHDISDTAVENNYSGTIKAGFINLFYYLILQTKATMGNLFKVEVVFYRLP